MAKDRTNSPPGIPGSAEAIDHFVQFSYSAGVPPEERAKIECLVSIASSLERIADALAEKPQN